MTLPTLRNELIAALESNLIAEAAERAMSARNGISALVRLAYNKDTLVGWRAIVAIGVAAPTLLKKDYAALRELIRRMRWSLTDESGGIGWSAPEILGELVSADPHQMADIVPLIADVFSIEERVFRPGVLYALARIAATDLPVVAPFQSLLLEGLSDPDALVRIRAIELAQALRPVFDDAHREQVLAALWALANDHAEAWVYQGDGFVNVLVSEAALAAIATQTGISYS